ncbi:hypothetical protein FIBSPDRAFT_959973 [Athelia psychrophila]|uniref:Uncharacterized protein n=1 Tax=Athelia psychrophila TaxID=1759441 RepID=A0A166CYL3_9AGAM|nr:hypothetical protein FIBSPDRAFT_959973 [Fibularhizoctonia sp. CBS 109695]
MLQYTLTLGPKPADVRAAEEGLWKLCLEVASGKDILPLLQGYLEEHCGPSPTEPDYPSATWFTHEGDVIQAVPDADVEEVVSDAESDSSGPGQTRMVTSPPPSASPAPDPSAEENRRS